MLSALWHDRVRVHLNNNHRPPQNHEHDKHDRCFPIERGVVLRLRLLSVDDSLPSNYKPKVLIKREVNGIFYYSHGTTDLEKAGLFTKWRL